MLTRLQVSGFKNLVDVDVYFGPFTCIAGANGVGKSNLFDAIRFLSALADRPLMDAALSVRDEGGRANDVASLFHRVGNDPVDQMTFTAEMIIPHEGFDDLGQRAEAAITFVEYTLVLGLRTRAAPGPLGPLEIRREVLRHIPLGAAPQRLGFPHKASVWRRSAVKGRRTAPFFISTEGETGAVVIRSHADSGSDSGGRPLSRSAASLPRTVLSVANAAESRTALLTKREMQAWRLLQLEPSALRRPDEFTAPVHLGSDGSHLPATLFHLAKTAASGSPLGIAQAESATYQRLALRLSELIDDVRAVWVDRDERRELLTLNVTAADSTVYPARSLSDGTLRFLALAVLELEPDASGVICLEEPENGIHPERIPAMLRLLEDIAMSADDPLGPDNPLRQVIVNTHSPVVVAEISDDSLLVAEMRTSRVSGREFRHVVFRPLNDTWRTRMNQEPVSKDRLLAYLNAVSRGTAPQAQHNGKRNGRAPAKVRERSDMQMLLPLPIAHRG